MNIYYHKKCNINVVFFCKNILRQSLGLFVPITFGAFYKKFVDCDNLFFFLLGIVLYSFIYCVSVWFVSMNDYEKNLLLKPVKRIIKRIEK